MVGISFGTIKSLLLFAGPILLPKAIGYYRSQRAAPQANGLTVRPVPPNVSRALTILFITSLAFLIKTFPTFTTPSVFTLTQSRLLIPTDVLFTRLHALRPNGFTPQDESLRSSFASREMRLLYLKYGPETITECSFCNPEDPASYLYYSLLSITIPHLFNLCVIALATSNLFIGKETNIWRGKATIVAGAIAILDIFIVARWNHSNNATALRLEDIDHFYWNMQLYRSIALAALDGLIGWCLYLSSTNRAFLAPPSTAEKIESTTRIIEQARGKLNGVALMRNATVRDKELRNTVEEYWVREATVMREVLETREVVDGVRNALDGRLDLVQVQRDAEGFTEAVLGGAGNVIT
ncbi:hypothetical protein SS1G_03946 [Sclerotinia sclerotiorum 1980 UF-70]|uniref:Chorismate synthase protein n=2 Tax=Sclerotinia sclerotiorum (strain ATCC 18683 / 1980 / Ss-1) TaxID=665079 RepID=A7EF55_SCLS1|nr:hypothetical protein SS1G_03946 [Sclerotinia sclerotiorum 1980 UF-70]APA12454.1 hypothetical protein sscle_09g072240 [Sclerotinia sclerotiorum 1980 UF-70]EDO01471.1 hypothetical protein SS1G_03946 [Sclerotinia sclerotiorum 1980 UF-70]